MSEVNCSELDQLNTLLANARAGGSINWTALLEALIPLLTALLAGLSTASTVAGPLTALDKARCCHEALCQVLCVASLLARCS